MKGSGKSEDGGWLVVKVSVELGMGLSIRFT